MLEQMDVVAWVVMAVCAMLIGVSKTSFGGIGAISAALAALVLPAKESTALILALLILGDVIGVARYGRNVRWKLILRLIPTIIPGLLLGALFMRHVDNVTMRHAIGVILLVSVLLQLWQRRRAVAVEERPDHTNWLAAGATGVAAGFTTMTANAAGPVMALYFLSVRLDKTKFIGTNAWFFFLVNVSKIPLTASLGLFTPDVLTIDLMLVPAVLVGAVIGITVIRKVNQKQFETVTLVASAVSALVLLLR